MTLFWGKHKEWWQVSGKSGKNKCCQDIQVPGKRFLLQVMVEQSELTWYTSNIATMQEWIVVVIKVMWSWKSTIKNKKMKNKLLGSVSTPQVHHWINTFKLQPRVPPNTWCKKCKKRKKSFKYLVPPQDAFHSLQVHLKISKIEQRLALIMLVIVFPHERKIQKDMFV
jgi:hypothetical protein